MLKKPPHRIVEIEVHQSNKRKRLAHAVALIFPCNHKKYLGLTLWKETLAKGNNFYRVQDCTIIKLEQFEIMDKEICKLCPQDTYWLNDLTSDITEDIINALIEEEY